MQMKTDTWKLLVPSAEEGGNQKKKSHDTDMIQMEPPQETDHLGGPMETGATPHLLTT